MNRKPEQIDKLLSHDADPEKSNIVILLVERILQDRPFGKLDEQAFWNYFFSLSHSFELSEDEIKLRVKKFQQVIPSFMEQVMLFCNNVLDDRKRMFKYIDKTRKIKEMVTPGVHEFDHLEVIKFAKRLTKPHYSFAEGERLVGTTRQTLKSYAEANTNGFTLFHPPGSKQARLKREELINFFRTKNYHDYNILTDDER